MIIRAAEPADAAGIATVHVRSWQHAYRGLLPQEFLDGMTVEPRIPGWAERLAQLDAPRSAVSVATTADGTIVGFVHTCPSRDGDADPELTAELTSIYLLRDYLGQGYGRGLMRASLATMSEAGAREATLWVLDKNARAIRFYEAAGWHADGILKTDQLAGIEVTEVRYRRALP